MTTTTVRTDLGPRLQSAAIAVADARETYETELARRDELIVQAVEEGMEQGLAGRLAGVGRTRVWQLLAKATD